MSAKTFDLICDFTIEQEINKLIIRLNNPFDCSSEETRISSKKKKRFTYDIENKEKTLDELVGQVKFGNSFIYVEEEDRR